MEVISVEFKRYMQTKGYAKKTIELYMWGVNEFKKWLQVKDINDIKAINHQTILDYQSMIMTSPTASETKAVMIRAIKRLFEWLINTHQLLINPAEGIIETHRHNRKIGATLTVEQMKRLLDQPNLSLPMQIRDRAIMEVLYATGIRSNELLNVCVYDVDLQDKVVFVRKGKGGKQRVVPLGKSAVVFLKEYMEKVRPRYAKKNPKERKLFLNIKGLPITWNAIRASLFEYRKKAGIEKAIGLHVFRRSCATHMLKQGADIRYIQKLLGHKYLKTTQQYIKVMPVDVKKTHTKTHPNTKEGNKKNED